MPPRTVGTEGETTKGNRPPLGGAITRQSGVVDTVVDGKRTAGVAEETGATAAATEDAEMAEGRMTGATGGTAVTTAGGGALATMKASAERGGTKPRGEGTGDTVGVVTAEPEVGRVEGRKTKVATAAAAARTTIVVTEMTATAAVENAATGGATTALNDTTVAGAGVAKRIVGGVEVGIGDRSSRISRK